MIGLFWKKGFYFNGGFYIYGLKNFNFITKHFGLSSSFSDLVFKRNEGVLLKSNPISLGGMDWSSFDVYYSKYQFSQLNNLAISSLDQNFLFLFNFYCVKTYPVMFSIKNQYMLNMVFFYLIKSFKGISLKIGRPLYRKTRARTYNHFKKSIKLIFPK